MIPNSYYHVKVFRSRSGLKPQNLFGLLILPWLLKVCSCKMLEPESPLATDTVAKVSVTVSSCCCRKLLQVQWLQISHICCFLILDVRSSERSRQGCIPFLEPQGKTCSCCFWLPSSHLHSLTCGLFLHLQNQQQNIFESLFKKII